MENPHLMVPTLRVQKENPLASKISGAKAEHVIYLINENPVRQPP